jgi:hypothetical protein
MTRIVLFLACVVVVFATYGGVFASEEEVSKRCGFGVFSTFPRFLAD